MAVPYSLKYKVLTNKIEQSDGHSKIDCGQQPGETTPLSFGKSCRLSSSVQFAGLAISDTRF